MLVKKGQSHDCYLEEVEATLGSLDACVFVCFLCECVCVSGCVCACTCGYIQGHVQGQALNSTSLISSNSSILPATKRFLLSSCSVMPSSL